MKNDINNMMNLFDRTKKINNTNIKIFDGLENTKVKNILEVIDKFIKYRNISSLSTFIFLGIETNKDYTIKKLILEDKKTQNKYSIFIKSYGLELRKNFSDDDSSRYYTLKDLVYKPKNKIKEFDLKEILTSYHSTLDNYD